MKPLKKTFTILILMLVVFSLLAACSPNDNETGDGPAAPADTEADAEDEADESEADSESAESDVVVVKYTYPIWFETPQLQMVENAMNEMIAERLDPKIQIDLDPIPFGNYADQTNLRSTAGEVCDILFTAKWMGVFDMRFANGDLLNLDPYLDSIPDLVAAIPEEAWYGTTVDGSVWAIPGNQQHASASGVNLRIDLLEKYPLDLESLTTYEDLEPWIEEVLAGEESVKNFVPVGNYFRSDYYGFDPILTGMGGGTFTGGNGTLGVRYDDETLTVVNLFTSEEFKDYIARTTRWYELGYISEDIDLEIAQHPGWYAGSIHFAQAHSWWDPANGFPLVGKSFAPLFYANSRVGENNTGICATSEHPLEALQVYELINTDPEVFNTLVYGVEGRHWTWINQDINAMRPPDFFTALSSYSGPSDFVVGNQFIGYYISEERGVNDIWQMEKDLNEAAVPSVLLGFHVDTRPIQTEIAQVASIVDQYMPAIVWGWDPDWETNLEDLNAMLEDAGIQTIVDEVQRQVNEWAASK